MMQPVWFAGPTIPTYQFTWCLEAEDNNINFTGGNLSHLMYVSPSSTPLQSTEFHS
jgi:hypothetical protein